MIKHIWKKNKQNFSDKYKLKLNEQLNRRFNTAGEGISELKNMLWDALQSDNNEQTIAEIVVPELPDVTDHPYYQQFNSNDEEEE